MVQGVNYYYFFKIISRTKYLQNTLAKAMFSSIDSRGTTKIAEPSVEAISTKVYVWLPTVAENGGGDIVGRPGFTSPGNLDKILWLSNLGDNSFNKTLYIACKRCR